MDIATYARTTNAKPSEFKARLKEHGLEVTTEIVRRWLSGLQAPGFKSVAAIEAATGGAVTRHDLRPDIYGQPPKKSGKSSSRAA